MKRKIGSIEFLACVCVTMLLSLFEPQVLRGQEAGQFDPDSAIYVTTVAGETYLLEDWSVTPNGSLTGQGARHSHSTNLIHWIPFRGTLRRASIRRIATDGPPPEASGQSSLTAPRILSGVTTFGIQTEIWYAPSRDLSLPSPVHAIGLEIHIGYLPFECGVEGFYAPIALAGGYSNSILMVAGVTTLHMRTSSIAWKISGLIGSGVHAQGIAVPYPDFTSASLQMYADGMVQGLKVSYGARTSFSFLVDDNRSVGVAVKYASIQDKGIVMIGLTLGSDWVL